MGVFRRPSGVGASPLQRLERKVYRIEEFLQAQFPEIPRESQGFHGQTSAEQINEILNALQERNQALAALIADGQLPSSNLAAAARSSVIGGFQIDPATLGPADAGISSSWASTSGHTTIGPGSGIVTHITCELTVPPGAGSAVIGTVYISTVASALSVTVSNPNSTGAENGWVNFEQLATVAVYGRHNGTAPAAGSALFLIWGYLLG